jgi:HAD superfamily hydrolase (TIGR01484 family)
MKKIVNIVACDFDGTIRYNNRISEEDKEAITSFRESGGKFGVVTGRDVESTLWVIREMKGYYDFLICCTGAVIFNGDGEIIFSKKQTLFPEMYDIAKKAISLDAGYFLVSDMLTKCYVDTNGYLPIDLSKINKFTQANAWFPEEKNAIKFQEYLQKNHSNRLLGFRNGGAIDMPPVGFSKTVGIYTYADMYDNYKVYTAGDNYNDIPMLEEFESYAVSNANDDVKAIANHRCDRICDMIKDIMEKDV